ncbi:MAG: DUF4912 domain-containing protein [Oscillospiraceae bacterium]|nr:DUF4912 domain-containing protein [Oscillospiraceae bacterium]
MLAQTPKRLFVYWDIADEDRANYETNYGENFWNVTKPVLIVHNTSKGYSFEIEVNDFANSWYFDVDDQANKYVVELGRRPVSTQTFIPNNYLQIASSNTVESPNDHILFEPEQNIVFFRNVKTNAETSRNIATLNLLKYAGKSYSASDIYRKIYRNNELFDANNLPSS